MFNSDVLKKISYHFPKVNIRFKEDYYLFKFMSLILFFAKLFITNYTMTIGDIIYFPSRSYINAHPVTSLMVLTHELVHIYDEKKYGKILYMFLYGFPQLLFLPILLLVLINCKIGLVISLFFLLPIPAYFRMKFEKRAYLLSLYSMHILNKKHNYNIDLVQQKDFFVKQFKNVYYYFMWPFSDIEKEFDTALNYIQNNKKPYEDYIFDIIDDILSVA